MDVGAGKVALAVRVEAQDEARGEAPHQETAWCPCGRWGSVYGAGAARKRVAAAKAAAGAWRASGC